MGDAIKGLGRWRVLIAILLGVLWHTSAAGQGPPSPTAQNPPLDSTLDPRSAAPAVGVASSVPSGMSSPALGSRPTIAPDSIQSPYPVGLDFSLPPSRSPWYGSIDALALQRNVEQREDFALATLGPAGPTVLSTHDLYFDASYGGRAMVGHMLSQCFSLEAVCYTTGSWSDTELVRDEHRNSIGGFGNLFSTFTNFGNPPIDGLDYNNLASVHNLSNLQDFELNLRWNVPVFESLAISFLAGARYLQIPEQFDYFAQSTSPTVAESAVHVRTENNALGVQAGSMLELAVTGRFLCDLEIKGAMLNDWRIRGRTSRSARPPCLLRLPLGSGDRPHRTSPTSISNFLYRWTPHFTTQAGYQALWVWDVALAEENFTSNMTTLQLGPARLNHTGSVVYYGPHAGIMLSW